MAARDGIFLLVGPSWLQLSPGLSHDLHRGSTVDKNLFHALMRSGIDSLEFRKHFHISDELTALSNLLRTQKYFFLRWCGEENWEGSSQFLYIRAGTRSTFVHKFTETSDRAEKLSSRSAHSRDSESKATDEAWRGWKYFLAGCRCLLNLSEWMIKLDEQRNGK